MARLALLPGAGLLVSLASACGAAPAITPTAPSRPRADSAALVVPAPAVSPGVPARAAPPPPRPSSFPDGWIAGAAALPMEPPPAPNPRSLQALALQRSPQRLRVPALTALPLADLPVAVVVPEPDWSKEPVSAPSPEGAPDLYFDWRDSGASSRHLAFAAGGASGASAAIEVRGQRFGYFDLNFFSSFTLPDAPGGLHALCGMQGGTGFRQASWESLSLVENGQIRVEGATAWFDYHTCRMHVMTRLTAQARPFAGGLGYAFRTRCPSCADQAEELHLILPEQGWSSSNRSGGFRAVHAGSPFSHLAVSLGPGAAGSIAVRVTPTALERFGKLGAPIEQRRPAILGVELTRGAAEPEATALYYVLDAPPE